MMDLSPLANRDNWSIIASISSTLGVFFLVIGPRLKIVRNWIGEGLQEMLGQTAMREEMQGIRADLQKEIAAREDQHKENQSQFQDVKVQLRDVADSQEKHIRDTNLHNGKTS